ncbi:MAG: YtxH domain-containing protein [Patescibacteria group bacterium]|nr:YtxH domain-containing protein [Patescibacteria group bacterium]
MAHTKSRFGTGILLGAAIGALAAFFFAPKSGKENREMIQKQIRNLRAFIEEKDIDTEARKLFGEFTTQSKKLYNSMQKETRARLEELRAAIEELDTEKYKKQVAGIIDQLRKEGGATELLEKAQKHLMGYIKTGRDDGTQLFKDGSTQKRAVKSSKSKHEAVEAEQKPAGKKETGESGGN